MQSAKNEWFDIVDNEGNVINKALRSECHGNPELLHQVVHIHVFNSKNQLFLQKRSTDKDIQPGKWDTSVGGHVDLGESIETAAAREALEELKIKNIKFIFLFKYIHSNEIESELVHSYYCIYDQMPVTDPVEIDEGKFWHLNEIRSKLAKNIFTPNFEHEFSLLEKKLKDIIIK